MKERNISSIHLITFLISFLISFLFVFFYLYLQHGIVKYATGENIDVSKLGPKKEDHNQYKQKQQQQQQQQPNPTPSPSGPQSIFETEPKLYQTNSKEGEILPPSPTRKYQPQHQQQQHPRKVAL